MFFRQKLSGIILSQLLVVVALVLVLLPLVLIVGKSLEAGGPMNYVELVQQTPFLTFIRNSAIVSVVTVATVVVLALSAAYAVEILRPPGAVLLKLAILMGLTLPGIAIVVPLFSLAQVFGLVDTLWAVIVPLIAISIPFGVLLAGNYMRELPVEIHEAARLDGAGPWRYLVSIMLPLCRPILAVVAVFTFLTAWNEYVLPLIFLQSADLQVATQLPSYFQGDRQVDLPKVFAANVLISIPIVLVYLSLQRSFRQGLTSGSVK